MIISTIDSYSVPRTDVVITIERNSPDFGRVYFLVIRHGGYGFTKTMQWQLETEQDARSLANELWAATIEDRDNARKGSGK